MLNHATLRSLAAGIATILIAALIPATATAKPQCERKTSISRACRIMVEVPGSSSTPREAKIGTGNGEKACVLREEGASREVACDSGHGRWSNTVQSWCRPVEPQPPKTDPAWGGRTTGAIYRCTRPLGDIPDPEMATLVWRASPEEPTVDPEDLARRVLTTMDFQAITMGLQPAGQEPPAVVNWHQWMWAVTPTVNQWGPLTTSATDSGITVTLSGHVDRVEWDMGNGDTVTCGKGTSFVGETQEAYQKSPDCGYQYPEPGEVTVTATSHWNIHWSGGGQSGTLPVTVSATREVRVVEIRTHRVSPTHRSTNR